MKALLFIFNLPNQSRMPFLQHRRSINHIRNEFRRLPRFSLSPTRMPAIITGAFEQVQSVIRKIEHQRIFPFKRMELERFDLSSSITTNAPSERRGSPSSPKLRINRIKIWTVIRKELILRRTKNKNLDLSKSGQREGDDLRRFSLCSEIY